MNMMRWRKEVWFVWAGMVLLFVGINLGVNAGNIRQICLFLSGAMISTGVLILISFVWELVKGDPSR